LPCKLLRLPGARPRPSDLRGDVYGGTAPDCAAVGNAARRGPFRRLEDLHHARSLNLNLCSFPVSVRGRASTNSTRRGYLYGAIAPFTWSCKLFASASDLA